MNACRACGNAGVREVCGSQEWLCAACWEKAGALARLLLAIVGDERAFLGQWGGSGDEWGVFECVGDREILWANDHGSEGAAREWLAEYWGSLGLTVPNRFVVKKVKHA